MSESPAVVLRQAAAGLRAPDAGCQVIDCGCCEEMHRKDADGVTWCKDCFDAHRYMPAPGEDIPERLREPLAGWLEAVVAEMTVVDGTEYQAYDDDQNEFSSWNAALTTAHIILGTPKETTA